MTAALHIQWGSHGTSSYEIVIGGKSLTAKFTLKKFMGLEDRDNGGDTAEVTAKINPEAIEFPVNRSVTKWRPITTMFPDLHVSEGANVRWETKQVLVRLRLKANLQADSTSNPVLLLEALVLPEGTWEAVPGPKQKLLSSNHSSAIRLWSTECTWYSPLPQYKLPTVSGMMRLSLDTNLPAEFKFRWTQQAVLRRCDHGRTVVSKKEYEAYMDKPYMTYRDCSTPFWLPYPFGIVENTSHDPDLFTEGGPTQLTPQEIQDNLAALHKLNDATKHPAQTDRVHTTPSVSVVNSAVPADPASNYLPPLPSGSRDRQQLTQTGTPQHNQATLGNAPTHTLTAGPGVGQVYSLHQSKPAASPSLHDPDDVLRGQEVTQYCPMEGCTWVPFKTYDKAMLATCFEMLKWHMKIEHSISDSDNPGSTTRDKTSREYQAATKPRTITNILDDATFNLCEARFFPFPLDLKVLGRNMPTVISPINTVVDVSHFGVDVTNNELLKKLHNRATNNLRLKEFSDSNLRNFHAAGDMLVAVQATKDNLELGKKQKQLEDTKECIKAFYNFSALSRNFHPLDWSPMALAKVALEKFLQGTATVEQFTKLFEKFIHENSVRAQRRATPLTYQEVLLIWTTYISANTTINTASIEALVDKKLLRSFPPNNRSRTGSGEVPEKRQRLTRDDFCPHWNKTKTPPFCSNAQVQGGCIDPATGKVLKHACNAKDNSRYCNSDKHGFYSH